MTTETTPTDTIPMSSDQLEATSEDTQPEVPDAEKEAVYDALREVVLPAGAPAQTTTRFFGEELFVNRETYDRVAFTLPDDLDEELGIVLRFDSKSHEDDAGQSGLKVGFLDTEELEDGEVRLLANRSHIIARLANEL